MVDQGEKHRVIGIRHVLRQLKNAGLIEEDSFYGNEAVADVRSKVLSRAVIWYKIGARRGALEILEAFLDGNFKVRKKADGSREIVAKVDIVQWEKRLKVTIGRHKHSVEKKTYRLTTEELGFE